MMSLAEVDFRIMKPVIVSTSIQPSAPRLVSRPVWATVFLARLAGLIAVAHGCRKVLLVLYGCWLKRRLYDCVQIDEKIHRSSSPVRIIDHLVITVAPLDRFSFPSGHTLYAVCFTILAVSMVPALAWVLWPFTIMVALSRLVLGLHFISMF